MVLTSSRNGTLGLSCRKRKSELRPRQPVGGNPMRSSRWESRPSNSWNLSHGVESQWKAERLGSQTGGTRKAVRA